jgi:hypothetical protein
MSALMPPLCRPKDLIFRAHGAAVPLLGGRSPHSGGRGRHGSDGNLISIKSPIATLPHRYERGPHSASELRAISLLDDHLPLEADLEAVDQDARCSQAGKLDHGLRSELKDRSERHGLEVQAYRQHVFSEIAGPEFVALWTKCIQQLGWDEMDLACIRHCRTVSCQIAMTDEAAGVRVPFDAEPFQKDKAVSNLLAKFVFALAGEAGNPARRRDSGYRPAAGLVTIHAFFQRGTSRTVSCVEQRRLPAVRPIYHGSGQR